MSKSAVEEDRKEKRVKLKTVIDWGGGGGGGGEGGEEILKTSNMSEWLAYELDKTGKYVVSMSCRTCKKFEEQLKGMNFMKTTSSWITGTSNLQKSNVKDHAKSARHKKSYELNHKKRDLSVDERASLLSAVDNRTITKGIGNMRGQEVQMMKRLFETAYMATKEEVSICKFGVLVNNERRHGVDNGLHAYANNMKYAEFIDYIGKSMFSD